MRWLARACFLSAIAIVVASPVFGAEQEAKQKAAKRPTPAVFTFPKEITLTEDQQAKLKAIQDEFGPKLAELQKKQTDLLTPEQKKARADAAKANKDANKTGKAAQQATMAALKLTPEQQTKWDAVAAELKPLRAKIEEKKLTILTDEQKTKLPARKGKAKNK
jgi:Spy/CpxP family protein refolding chaperone